MESKETENLNHKKDKRKGWIIVIGSLIILLGIFYISLMYIKPTVIQEQEEKAFNNSL